MEEKRVLLRLGGIVDRLAMRQRKHEAAADEQHGQRGDERRHLQDGDEHAVDEADHRRRAARQRITEVTTPRSRKLGANSLAKTTATRP